MKFTVGFVLGMLGGLAIWRAPYYAGSMMDRVPPETPEGHEPRYRTWHNGEEVR